MFIYSSQEGTGSEKRGLELRLELSELYKSITGNCEAARRREEEGERAEGAILGQRYLQPRQGSGYRRQRAAD